MNDMSKVIIAKSDQLNSDDLMAGPITVKISGVTINSGGEQPVAINYEGDKGKPWKCCKSMSRVLVAAWGPDASKYVGRSVTLYRDPTVKWGGMEVGGIRISHMSHIERKMVLALTATKGNKKPFEVQPLRADVKPLGGADFDPDAFVEKVELMTVEARDAAELKTWWESVEPERKKLARADQEKSSRARSLVADKLAMLEGEGEV